MRMPWPPALLAASSVLLAFASDARATECDGGSWEPTTPLVEGECRAYLVYERISCGDRAAVAILVADVAFQSGDCDPWLGSGRLMNAVDWAGYVCGETPALDRRLWLRCRVGRGCELPLCTPSPPIPDARPPPGAAGCQSCSVSKRTSVPHAGLGVTLLLGGLATSVGLRSLRRSRSRRQLKRLTAVPGVRASGGIRLS